MNRGTRDQLIGCLAEAFGSVTVAHPARVAVDGPPRAGKTTPADELAVELRAQGSHVIRATIDDLLPRAQRYRRGEFPGPSCYFDAHDHDPEAGPARSARPGWRPAVVAAGHQHRAALRRCVPAP